MNYKSIDFVALWSLIMGALSVLGLVVLTVGPWADPSAQATRPILTISWFAFWMLGTMARSVRSLLEAQADQIDALQRQLAEQHPAA